MITFFKKLFKYITYKLQYLFCKTYQKVYFLYLQKRLVNKDFSLFSPNCYAGIIYHRLNLEFKSPTINMFFPSKKEYLKFVSNLRHYLNVELINCIDSNYDCPVGMVDDVKIVFNHYDTFEEAKVAWNRRKSRVNYDNIYIIYDDISDSDYSDLIKFNQIVCNNKVILTAKKYKDLENAIQIKKYSKDEVMKPYLLEKSPWTGKTPADKVFDYVNWLNSK